MSRHDIRLKLNRFQIQEKMFLDMEVAQKYKKNAFTANQYSCLQLIFA